MIGSVSFAQEIDGHTNQAQLRLDSILHQSDSLRKQINKVDSVVVAFQSQSDSIQLEYQKQVQRIDATSVSLQARIDSLRNLSLPTDRLTAKLDSLNQIKANEIEKVTSKIEALKADVTRELDKVNLPPQLQEPMQKLKASIKGYTLPEIDIKSGKLPKLSLQEFGDFKIPTLTDQINLDPEMKEFMSKFNTIHQWTDKADDYIKDATNLVQGKFDEVKQVDKTLEGKLSSIEGVDQLAKGKAIVSEYTQMDSSAIKAKAKELVQEQVMEFAQDHFADKKEVLQQAMDKVSKLKSKYSDVKSLAELPKRVPNPLKGRPLIERLVPGFSFQISKSDNFLLDVNPTLVYLITPRLSAGAGWNYRLTFDGWTITQEEEIYGPRGIFEVKWTKGIVFRLLPELMYTVIPPQLAQLKGVDPTDKKWVPSLFVGIKKQFTVYKTVKGNTELLYNLYDRDGESPYADRLSVRFGFEFPMKKKPKRSKRLLN